MRTAAVALSLVLAGCITQTPPAREPLPPVGDVVEPIPPCSVTLGTGSGIQINEVTPGSPSDGLLFAGDVLVGLDRSPLVSFSELLAYLDERKPGDVVTFEVRRDDASVAVDLTLGPPNAPSTRPSVGIAGTTRFEPTDLEGLTPSVAGDTTAPFVRMIDIGGRLYRFDPVGATISPTGITAPDGVWESADGRLFSASGSAIVDDTGRAVRPPEGLELAGLLGAVGDDLILALQSPSDGAVSVVRLDLDSDQAVWIRPFDISSEVPVGVLSAAVGEQIVVATAATDAPSTITGHQLWNAADGSPTGVEIDAARVYGFFDSDTLVGVGGDGGLVTIDTTTAAVEPLELGMTTAAGMSIVPVGDGRYILVAGGGTLRRADLGEPAEPRSLAENCALRAIGRAGAGI